MLTNTDEVPGATNDGSPAGSPQDTQPGANQPSADTTGNSATPGQQMTAEEAAALREENTRLKGQVSAVQKKYLNNVRKSTQMPAATAGDEASQQTAVFNAAMELSEAKLRNQLEASVFPFYDGTHPDAKGQPTLPPAEFARIRKNPWVFASRESFLHALRTGDLQPAMIDIEQAIADRVEELSATTAPTVKPKGAGIKQVNPSPAPVGGPNGGQPEGQNLWTMPMDQLEQMQTQAVQDLSTQR